MTETTVYTRQDGGYTTFVKATVGKGETAPDVPKGFEVSSEKDMDAHVQEVAASAGQVIASSGEDRVKALTKALASGDWEVAARAMLGVTAPVEMEQVDITEPAPKA